MRVLLAGHESEKRLALLLELTGLESEQVIEAVKYHLTNGMRASDAASLCGIPKGNLSRAIDAVNEKAVIVEKIKDIDFVTHNKVISLVNKGVEHEH